MWGQTKGKNMGMSGKVRSRVVKIVPSGIYETGFFFLSSDKDLCWYLVDFHPP